MLSAADKEETPIEVTLEDQLRICAFSRLYKRLQYLTTLSKLLADDVEKLEDAVTEVMIAEEDKVKYVFGESLFAVSNDEVTELLEEERDTLANEKKEVDEELNKRQKELADLKAVLQAKFGNQIYLDDQ